MKNALLIGFGTILAGSLWAAPVASQDITVTPGSPSIASFVTAVSQDLDRQLERVHLSSRDFGGGFAQVRFQVDDDGQVDKVILYRRSGDGETDRAALQVVRRLAPLGALPVGARSDQIIQANIIIATSEMQLMQLHRKAEQAERARLASADEPQERAVIALTVSGDPSS
ncbi:MAG: energy transducer TonB [Erythrobacter sp.]